MTTFIDFRFLRAIATALFAGQEKEERDILLERGRDNYLALDIGSGVHPRVLARFIGSDSTAIATLETDKKGVVYLADKQASRVVAARLAASDSPIVGIRIGQGVTGLKTRAGAVEAEHGIFAGTGDEGTGLRLECTCDVRVMGRGSGRVARWGELFYQRRDPAGLCVELTMDWHHLRAGIPLFSTMTAEELVAEGKCRLRFRSYAYEEVDTEAMDFVRLFSSDAPPDIALHLTPSLFTPQTPGIPNLAFGVIESERVHPNIVARCNAMDRMVVPSTFVRDALVRNGVTCPVDVIPHGVDTEYFRPAAAKRPLPGGRSFNFLAVGTHVERKNFAQLVRAFLEEFREHEDVALFLLLRPEYHTTQHNVVLDFADWEIQWAQDSAPIFIWTGYLTREHLRDFYADANAYVMPSNEGFGLTLLESMSCGTPAIGLKHGGVMDFLSEDNGILVPPGKSFIARDIDTLPFVGDLFHTPSIAALRTAMRRLFEAPEEAARLGRRARSDAEALSWREVTRRYSEVIARTHADYHAQRPSAVQPVHEAAARPDLTLVLCVMDDQQVRKSLRYLRRMARTGFRVLCLFTRYARVEEVMRARDYGFVNYRWDGTLENSKAIARSLFGRRWIALLHPGEKIPRDVSALLNLLQSQPPEVSAVSVRCAGNRPEARLFRVGPAGQASGLAACSEVSFR